MRKNKTKRQDEIVATAIDLISKEGIQQLTMKKIATRLKVSEPALYRHFDSKMDILLSILARFRESSAQILSQVLALQAPAATKLEALYAGFVARFTAQPSVAAVIFAEEIFQDDRRLSDAVRDLMNRNQQVLLEIVQVGQTKNEIRDDIPAPHLVVIVMGALRLTVARWRMSDHTFDLQHETAALWTSIQQLILPPAPAPRPAEPRS